LLVLKISIPCLSINLVKYSTPSCLILYLDTNAGIVNPLFYQRINLFYLHKLILTYKNLVSILSKKLGSYQL